MAPKFAVPADFGIENLYDEYHGNVVLKLQNNAQMKGNSMILKMNSPVFGDIFVNTGLRVLDMDDFIGAAVTLFLEALYSGEIQPNKELFRDLHKLANVFKVTWLVARCDNYFRDLIQTTDDSNYDNMLFVFEEARYFKDTVTKKPHFLDMVVEKLCSLVDKETTFIERYMVNYLDLSANQLDLMIRIADEEVCVFMKMIKKNMELKIKEPNFDENSKYLLQHIDLVNCMEKDQQLFEDVFDLLGESENISAEDLKLLMKLNRGATKEYQAKQQSRVALPSTSRGEMVSPFQDIPYLFKNRNQFCGRGLGDEQLFHAFLSSTDVNNLFMLFELINVFNIWSCLTGKDLQKISEVKSERGWCPVAPAFLDGLSGLDESGKHVKNMLKIPSALVSQYAVRRLVCNRRMEQITLKDLLMKENEYKFYYPGTGCKQPTKCGFIIKVTPSTTECPEQFNMQLVNDPSLYPADIHLHDDEVSIDNIHLTIELNENTYFPTYYNMHASWYGKPIHINEKRCHWAGLMHNGCVEVRLVVYYQMPSLQEVIKLQRY